VRFLASTREMLLLRFSSFRATLPTTFNSNLEEWAICHGPMLAMNNIQSKFAASFGARPTRSKSNSTGAPPRNFQGAQRNYERYLALARAEALTGDRIRAENYYQHAEHYFRSMGEHIN
jgi:hypothetical protein